ncbi:MAG: GH32 C-terminal domain-containing protein [Anaerolineae bacterium]|nr:GH32 C-terminal domain-containing protein [Anaerolineae bacterium]
MPLVSWRSSFNTSWQTHNLHTPHVVEDLNAHAVELVLEIDTNKSPAVMLDVLRSPDRQEYTRITFYRDRGLKPITPDGHIASTPRGVGASSLISIDTSHSSILTDTLSRAPETAPVYLEPDENLSLRIFIDRSIVEVFVNSKQCVATRVYPARGDSTQVAMAIGAQGSAIQLVSLDAWEMKSIYL